MGVVTSADNLFGYLVRQLEDFDPRFDKRVGEQERLRNLQVGKELTNDPNAVPTIKLSELEGQDFITSMSDRTEAHGSLLDINGVPLNRPVQQRGGQGFMFDNPGLVWASGTNPVNQIMDAASGQRVNYMPWGMAPTGGDFSTSTGETMLAYASSAMSKAEKAEFDKAIRDYVTVGKKVKGEDGVSRQTGHGLSIKDWPGVDSPEAIKVWENTPDSVRKELMNMMDKRFRNRGGLGIGEARLANVDPRQANRPDGSLLNVGTIHGDKQAVRGIDNPSYPDGVPGEGQGTLDQQVNVFEMLPEVVKERKIPDPQNPRPSDLRALQMKPYRGTVTPEVLKALQARGVDVGNADPILLAALAASTVGAGSLFSMLDPDEDLIDNLLGVKVKEDQQ